MVMGKTINLIRFFIVTCVLFFCSVLNGNAQVEGQKQTKLVDYVWAVDVSGGSNIYLADVQQAIDSFYVKASRYGSLDVIRYASSVINDSTVMDDEFYKHSDQRAMLDAVCQAVENSRNNTVRVFVLSDFCNDTPLNGATRLLTDSLLTIRQKFMTMSASGKDVKLIMLILPPSTSPTGYSLDSIKTVIPEDIYMQYTVNSTDSLQSFIISQTDSLSYQLNNVGKEQPSWFSEHSMMLIILSVVLILVAGGAYYFFVYRKKNA